MPQQLLWQPCLELPQPRSLCPSSTPSQQSFRSAEACFQSISIKRLRRAGNSYVHPDRLRQSRLLVRWLRSQEQAAVLGELESRLAVAAEEQPGADLGLYRQSWHSSTDTDSIQSAWCCHPVPPDQRSDLLLWLSGRR